jgi:hypothetical protein
MNTLTELTETVRLCAAAHRSAVVMVETSRKMQSAAVTLEYDMGRKLDLARRALLDHIEEVTS